MESKERLKLSVLGDNLVYFVKELWYFKPQIVVTMLLIPLFKVAMVTAVNFLPKEIVRMAQERVTPLHLAAVVLSLMGIKCVCKVILARCRMHINDWGLCVRHHLERKALSRYCQTDYANVENPKLRELFQKSQEVFANWDKDARRLMWEIINLLESLLGILTYASVIAMLHPLILVILVFNAFVINQISKYHTKWVLENQESWQTLDIQSSYLLAIGQDFSNAKDIRLYGMKGWMMEMYQRLMKERLCWCRRMLHMYFFRGSLFYSLMDFFRNALAYGVLIHLVLEGTIRADEFVLYLAMVTNLSNWMNKIVQSSREVKDCAVYLTDYREFLAYPDEFEYQEGKGMPEAEEFPCSITLSNLSFTHLGGEKETLKNINLTIQPGEKIAIVGLNGAGKTTLIKNICGLYKPSKGSILINQTKEEEFRHLDYYGLFSVVFQDMDLLPGSILENVSMREKEESDLKRVEECLKKAGLWEKVSALPSKMDTCLCKNGFEDAVELSGGERQKLLLARALYKDAPILILDEPTAALDPIAENELYLKYQELTKGRTSIYISHRLSSTRFCDRILFLKDGEIIEEGSHDGLMEKGGEYARLFEIQSYYYQNDSTKVYESELDPSLGISGYKG